MSDGLETTLMIVGGLLISIVLSVAIALPMYSFIAPWRNSKWIDERKKRLKKMAEEQKEMEEKGEDDEKE